MADNIKTKVDQDFALVLLVKEIMNQLDEFHALRKKGSKGSISHELLREMCSVLPDLEDEQLERYFEILVSTTSKVEAFCPYSPSEEFVVASVEPKRKTINAISHKLGLKAA